MINPKTEEEKIQSFWKKNKIPDKVRNLRKGKNKYYFLDGPPYATGYIHLGTAWNKILKDIYIRYKRMSGFDVWDQPGYDTHGLPIENKVEKKLGFHSKEDIERLGIEAFNKECRKFATEFIDIMSNQFEDLGVWMDWKNPYLTLKNEYIEGAWFTFKTAFDKGFLYKDRYSVTVCPKCETAVAYNEVEYKNVTDPSIYVKFPVKGKKHEFLVIWTTTPWTLPGNTGIMAKPSAEYAYVKAKGETWIFAKELVERVMEIVGVKEYKIEKTIEGKDMERIGYVHPLEDLFTFHRNLKNAHKVVLSEQFVTLEEGTGLVHTAPGHGQEDYKVGKEYGLPIISPVKMNGTFDESCGRFAGVFTKSADNDIIQILSDRGLLLKSINITHDYPHCWRCDSPLLFLAVPQWFFRVTSFRKDLLSENKKVRWYPKWAGKRFDNWLESLGDWPVSRQRYWGIPLPIWECQECGQTKVIGSIKELPIMPNDLHRPYIDEITMECKCGGVMKRIPDVLDVWFDAGLAGWASLEYPNKKEDFERLWPADLNIEGPDQIRGWWNAELITSFITFEEKPFENILFHGFVLDAHGNKMSKSRGNIVAPEDIIERYGRDIMRFYLLSSPAWDDFYFNWTDTDNVSKTFNILHNTMTFVKTYVTEFPKQRPKLNIEDKWVLSRINSLKQEYVKQMERFHHHKAVEALQDFILNDFSRWYIKLVRDRTWPLYDGKDKQAAFYTLVNVLDDMLKLLSPLTPFIAEKGYQEIIKSLKGGMESVHMENLPVADKELVDKELEKEMELVKGIVEAVLAIRQKENIRLRWPINRVVILGQNKTIKNTLSRFEDVLLRMTNTKRIIIEKSLPHGSFSEGVFDKYKIYVDLGEDKKLWEERLYRELTRKIQEMRKRHEFVVTDGILLSLKSSQNVERALSKFEKKLKNDVGAAGVNIGGMKGKYKDKLKFGKTEVEIGFDKK